MQWYVTASLACCGACLVGVLGLLALTSYYVYDSDKNIPVDTSDDWMVHVTSLVPLTAIFAITLVVAAWVLISRNRKWFHVGLLVWNFLCFATCIYFVVMFNCQMNKDKVKGEYLFNKTKSSIGEKLNSSKTFIPKWLDSIQNKSKECCGIRTFRDFEEFWPEASTQVPKSCCKEANHPEKCFTDLVSIPFPLTPSNSIKTEVGCIDAINDYVHKNINDSWLYVIILCILFGLAEIMYAVHYALLYGNAANRDLAGLDDEPVIDDTLPAEKKKLFSFKNWGRRKKRQAGADLEGNVQDAGDLYGVSGSGSMNDSTFTASQGTLLDSTSQDPYFNKQEQLGSAGSSGSDTEVDAALGSDGKKKKKKKKGKKNKDKQDDMTGSDGQDGKVNRQEVFVVADSQPDDLLAQNGYDNNGIASPTSSNDDVGDKLAAGAKPKKGGLRGLLGSGTTGVQKVGAGIGSGVGTVGAGIGSGINTVGQGLGSGAKTVGQGLGSGAKTVGQGLGTGAKTVGQGLNSGAKTMGTGLTNVGSGIGSGFKTMGQGIGSGLNALNPKNLMKKKGDNTGTASGSNSNPTDELPAEAEDNAQM